MPSVVIVGAGFGGIAAAIELRRHGLTDVRILEKSGGFAVHGYHDVPPYQASHGCARIPLWAAHGVFTRWSIGDTVYVL